MYLAVLENAMFWVSILIRFWFHILVLFHVLFPLFFVCLCFCSFAIKEAVRCDGRLAPATACHARLPALPSMTFMKPNQYEKEFFHRNLPQISWYREACEGRCKKQPTNKQKSFFFLGTNCAKKRILFTLVVSFVIFFLSLFVSLPRQSSSKSEAAALVGLLLSRCEDVIFQLASAFSFHFLIGSLVQR